MDQFFKIGDRGSSVATELRAGLTTFLAMAYIIVVNPLILEAGGVPVTLGKRILRTETAPLAALSVIMYASGNMEP